MKIPLNGSMHTGGHSSVQQLLGWAQYLSIQNYSVWHGRGLANGVERVDRVAVQGLRHLCCEV